MEISVILKYVYYDVIIIFIKYILLLGIQAKSAEFTTLAII